MRVSYTPELIAHIRHRYENTDDTLAKIAEDCCVSERAINRLRDREKWPRRSDRPVRDLPPAMRQLEELTAELAARGPMPARGSGDWPPTPDPSHRSPGSSPGSRREASRKSARPRCARPPSPFQEERIAPPSIASNNWSKKHLPPKKRCARSLGRYRARAGRRSAPRARSRC